MKKQTLLFGIVFLFCIVGVLASSPYPVDNPDLMDYVYPLDSVAGTSFSDLLGGTDGVSIGNVDADWVAGQTNFFNAFKGDGVNNILMTQFDDWYNGDELSISVWINISSDLPGGANYDFFFGNSGALRGQVRVGITEDRIIVLVGDGASIQYQQYNSAADNFTIGRWNHLLLNIRGQLTAVGRYDLWINGNNQTALASATNVIINRSMNESLIFGALNASGTPGDFVNATFDDIVIGKKFLSDAEIMTRYLGDYDTIPPIITQINFTSDGGVNCSAIGYPNECSITEDLTPSFFLSLNEQGTCRISQTNESYDNMSIDCTHAGGYNVSNSCTLPTNSPLGSNTFYFGCLDSTGNNDTAPLNESNKANLTLVKIARGITYKHTNEIISDARVIAINQNTDFVYGNNSCLVNPLVTNTTGGFSINITSEGNYTFVGWDPNNSTSDGDADPFIEVGN